MPKAPELINKLLDMPDTAKTVVVQPAFVIIFNGETKFPEFNKFALGDIESFINLFPFDGSSFSSILFAFVLTFSFGVEDVLKVLFFSPEDFTRSKIFKLSGVLFSSDRTKLNKQYDWT